MASHFVGTRPSTISAGGVQPSLLSSPAAEGAAKPVEGLEDIASRPPAVSLASGATPTPPAQRTSNASHTPSRLACVSRVNAVVDEGFNKFGQFVSRHAVVCLLALVVFLALCALGLLNVEWKTDVYDLWIPRNSRLRQERTFIEEQFGSDRTRTNFVLAQKADGSETILTSALLSQWLDVSRFITQNISVSFGNRTLRWNDLCDRIPNPMLPLPCSKLTALDCFREGSFDFFLPPLPGVPPNLFAFKPSFANRTNEELNLIVNDSCRDWSNSPIPENFMMGGVLRNTSGTVQSVDSLQFVLSLGSLKSIASALFATRSPSDDQVREAQRVAEDWEQRLIDAVLSMEGSGRYGFRLHVFAKRTETDLLVDANSANFPLIVAGDLCVVLFTAIILARTDPLKSRALAAFVSVLLVCIGAISSLGLSALLGISFTALHLQVLPFLALGLGIDQFYLIALNFRTATNSHIQNSGLAMKESGASIALSTAMNLVAFGIAASMPLPAITLFASSACVAVAINFLISLVGFTAVLSLDSRRTLSGRADCIPCVKVNTTKLMPPACVQELGSDGTPVDQGVPTEAAGSGLSSKIGRIYGGCIIRPVSKAVILSGAAALICIASYGVTQLEVGLPLADIVPADHFAATFLKVREESYTDFEASIITGMGPDGVPVPLDYARALPQLRQAQSELQRVPRVNARVPIAAVSWVDNFILYVAQNSPGNLTSDGYPAPAFFYPLLRQWLVTARGVSFASRLRFNDDGTLRTTSIRFFMTGISTAEDMVRVIEDTRSVLDRQPLPLFPEGFVFNFYEQYLNVGPTLVRNLVWVVLGVAPVSFLVLLHPGAALIMLAHIGMIVLLLVGFMPFFGLLLNGVSIVNTIMAVGVSVEYVSHMVRAFMVAPGTRETRVILSLGSILLPNLAGAVATALGVLPIAFARYPYFKLYFFAMYTMIAVASAVVGLVVLPAVLALVGPLSGGSVTKDRRASLKWTTSHSEMTGVAKKESVAVVPVGN